MKSDEIRSAILQCLSNIAPEADSTQLRTNVPLRDQLDLDSVDLLNFLIGLHKQFKIEIPEKDYSHLMTLEGCVRYISNKV